MTIRLFSVRRAFEMCSLFFWGILSLVWVSPSNTFAEPYKPSCGAALERVYKARKSLIPYQRTMELARARERKAYGELTICTGGGIYNVTKASRCNEATWKAPERTRKVIDAEDDYLQGKKVFEKLFEQAKQECLSEQ